MNPQIVYKPIQVSVPEKVDRLIREFCRLDGSDIDEFYRHMFLDSLQAYFNAGELLNLEGLARIHGLHEAFNSLDPEYGEKKQ
jgi:hypothetical protein